MANVGITIRVDEELKKEAEPFFEELGMTFSTAFNIFVRQCLREQKIPFEIGRSPGGEQEPGSDTPDSEM